MVETISRFPSPRLAALGLVAALLLPAVEARATSPTTFQTAVQDLAAKVKAELSKHDQKVISVGEFRGRDLPDSTSGPGVQAVFQQELQRVGLAVRSGALYVLKGEYAFRQAADTGWISFQVVFRLSRTDGKPAVSFPDQRKISSTDMRDLAKYLQLMGQLPPGGTGEERNKTAGVVALKPTTHLHGTNKTLVSSSADSDYAVELLAGPAAARTSARPAALVGGRAVIPLERDEVYQVRLINRDRKREVAAAIAVDGIDVFHFTENRDKAGRPSYSHFIIAAAKEDGTPGEVIVPGWHNTSDPKRKDHFLSFLLTEHGKGAASREPLLSKGNVGSVQVAFSQCFRPGETRSGAETGFGEPVTAQQKVVERVIDPAHDFVTIRYEEPKDKPKK